MLCFEVRDSCDIATVRKNGSGWAGLGVGIYPVVHETIESSFVSSPGGIEIIVREKGASDGARDGEWELEYLSIRISKTDAGARVELRAGEWGTCPVYAVCDAGGIIGNWDVVELFGRMRSPSLCPVFSAHFLAGLEHPYGASTIFPRIRRMTAGSKAEWRAGWSDVQVNYPAAVEFAGPHRLKPGADVPGAFDDSLMSSLQRFGALGPEGKRNTGVLLSGGLDSAITAIATARAGAGTVRSYGLLMPGGGRDGQKKRRAELVQSFGFRDNVIDTENYCPLDPASERVRDFRFVPWEECYLEAFTALLKTAESNGDVTLMTGNGGDELCMPYWFELSPEEVQRRRMPVGEGAVPPFLSRGVVEAFRDTARSVDRAPATTISSSSLSASASSAALFMRHGVWSLSPLCTPELIRLCRRLPREWRENREVSRRYLEARGCGATVTRPTSTEDFGPLMEAGLRGRNATFVAELFGDCRLADLGLVDGAILRSEYAHWRAGGICCYDPAHFLFTAMLELTVRSVGARYGRAMAFSA
ncbi:MAG: hypothetical protein QOJ99_2248 [Bryobacterales bacterium]|jgi:asparagine synthase (glutamine-hydrolysing)|nr:hypothetical protein [Bryobacterales bacterium]